MEISQLLSINQQAIEAVNALMPQLTPDAPAISAERLTSILHNRSTRLYLGYEHGRAAGMYSLAYYPLLSGDKVWLEDVVVSSECRGKGFGRQLVEHAIAETARLYPEAKLMLTSRPQREAANRLYSSLFHRRDTNVYARSGSGGPEQKVN